jgi:hypothetical protein
MQEFHPQAGAAESADNLSCAVHPLDADCRGNRFACPGVRALLIADERLSAEPVTGHGSAILFDEPDSWVKLGYVEDPTGSQLRCDSLRPADEIWQIYQ